MSEAILVLNAEKELNPVVILALGRFITIQDIRLRQVPCAQNDLATLQPQTNNNIYYSAESWSHKPGGKKSKRRQSR